MKDTQLLLQVTLSSLLAALIITVPSSVSPATSTSLVDKFVNCIITTGNPNSSSVPGHWVFDPESPQFSSLLDSKVQNMRYLNSTSRPDLILTPSHHSQIQSALLCTKKLHLDIRTRSGGHDYQGLSYLSPNPYVVLDLLNLNAVQLDPTSRTAWVQSGAQLGDLYYAIAKQSTLLAFPAGICPTVGIGGHLSGGGFGALVRKHGMAADHVVDAHLVDARGRILDRAAMGEEVFWAIRGGGASSFGIVLTWKVRLVSVPPKLTFFTVHRTLEQGATHLVHKCQLFAHAAHEDLFVRTIVLGEKGQTTSSLQVSFQSLFLSTVDKLIQIMNRDFPELGLRAEDCREGSWGESAVHFAGFGSGSPLKVLLDRTQMYKASFKAKADFVTEPVPESGLEGMWKLAVEEGQSVIIMEPLGGRMEEIPESYTPFPHRKGNLYNIQYLAKWWGSSNSEEEKRHLEWMKKLYDYMEPFVSSSPRAAYLNYRDLDLGANDLARTTSFSEARMWGDKYFRGNFERLSKVKSLIDPQNFFRNEQSIPLFTGRM